MARGPQVISQPGGSVTISYSSTTASIQTAINANAPGTTFWIEKGGGTGVRAQTAALVPKTGDVFVFEFGAVLDGSTWSTTDRTQASFRAHNENIDTVTIENGTIRNMPQKGIHAFRDFSSGWIVRNCEVEGCIDGVSLPGGSTLQRCLVHDNIGNPTSSDVGARGGGYVFNCAYGATATITVDDNEFYNNGPEQKSIDASVINWTDNWLHDEYVGIWCDGYASGSTITGNTIEDTEGAGIMWEQCQDGLIYANTIRRAGEAGIFVSTSKNNEIYDNTLEECWRGIHLFLDFNAIGSQPWNPDLSDNNVHDNSVTLGTRSGSIANLFSYIGTPSTSSLAPYLDGTKNNLFIDNTYTAPSTGSWWFWGNAHKTFAQWQAIPQDAAGMEFPTGSPGDSPGGSPGSSGGSVESGGGTSIPIGSLLFAPYNPDDYPALVSNTGVFLGVPDNDPLFDTDGFGTVTNGVIALDNGRICVNNLGNFQVGVFNADGTLRAVNPSHDPRSIAGGYDTGYFYGIQDFGTYKVQKFDSNDASLVTEWAIGSSPFAPALAVAKDESYAYFAASFSNPDVKRLNLSTLAVTTFITAPGGSFTSGVNSMFCLRDGSLMVAWGNNTIVHYDTGGSVLHTYTRSSVLAITPGLTDSSFWVHYNTGTSFAQEIQVSSGTLLHDFELPTGDPPAAHAGNSSSENWGVTFCILTMAMGVPEVVVLPPPGTPPDPILVNSDPCCDTGGTTPTPNAGPVLQGIGWIPQCAGGGGVPSAPALTDSENWDV